MSDSITTPNNGKTDRFADLKASLKKYEGCVPYMYLDTKGNVTIGVGHLLKTCADAEKCTFIIRASGKGAALADVMSDFNHLSGKPKGELWTHYRQFTLLDMPPEAIEALLEADIAEKESAVRNGFPGYDNYPTPAKAALLDMAFNLGVTGLIQGFPNLKAAAEKHDWATCAKQCIRRDIQADRNTWTQQQFEKAGASGAGSAT